MGRDGQPVCPSAFHDCFGTQIGSWSLLLCFHVSVHQICSNALSSSLGSAVGVFTSPHQCISTSRNMQMSRAELVFDSPD